MSLSTNGLIGAAIGLVLAGIEYVTILAMFERRAKARAAALSASEGGGVMRSLAVFQLAFRLNFVLLPVLGYFLGSLVLP